MAMARLRTLCLHLSHVLLFLSLPFCRSSAAPKDGNSADAQAMSDLAKSLTNLPPSWKGNGNDMCNWDGVTCDASGRVSSINLASIGVSGVLPASISSLTALTSLQLQRNFLSGPLPSLYNFSSLQFLFLDGNGFSSIPADFFSGMTSLQKVSLDDVPFAEWKFSTDLAAAASLTEFSASNASIAGTVPEFFGSLVNLQVLRLSYNTLTGGLPSSFAGSSIQQLLLNNQQSPEKFTGRIDVIGQMPQLVVLWLQSNTFSGPIPDVSNLTSLESFNVRDNALTGVVPSSLISCKTLKNVTLSNNKLQGPFPQFAGTVTVDVNKGNNFCNTQPGPCDDRVTVLLEVAAGFGYPPKLAKSWTGNLPCANWFGVNCDTLGNSVTVLNFASQHFEGIISPAMANLTSLTKIILSNNTLTGSIPDSLTQLSQLQLLDVTNNNLTGKVPTFASSVTLKLSGNPLLGTDSDSGGGSPSDGTSSSAPSGSASGGKWKSSPVAVAIGIVIAIVILIGCSVALFFHYRSKKLEKKSGHVPAQSPHREPEMIKMGDVSKNVNVSRGGLSLLHKQSSTESANALVANYQGMYMSIHSLLKATNNFSEENIIGRGGFGVVYKGNLNETLIAVKRNECDLMGKKGLQEFKAEIDVLRKVKHRNLVTLLGYYDDGRERLLVYEFMPGGTLGQHLFEWRSRNEPPLTWKQRLTIALDVARGIEYLHSLAQESFIHRDLKPSNILLDKDLRAKVSDFGLVKLAEDKHKSMMTRLAGTFGYLAPEYATTGRASAKVDVYAFGVILMEIITGRKVLDESLPAEECNLVPLFRRKVSHEKDKLLNAVDIALDLDEEASQSLLEVADLAWHCTAREHYQRPDMSHVVNRLAPLVEQWKPSNSCHQDDDVESSLSLSQRLERWGYNDCSSTELFSTHNL